MSEAKTTSASVPNPTLKNFEPMFDRILVRPIEEEETQQIVLTVEGQQKPTKGQVVSTGRGRVSDDGAIIGMVLHVGDVVTFNKYSGSPLMIENEEYLLMFEKDVIGFIRKEDLEEIAMAGAQS